MSRELRVHWWRNLPAAASCAVTSSCTVDPRMSLSSNVVLSGELGSSLNVSDIIVVLMDGPMLIVAVVAITLPSEFIIGTVWLGVTHRPQVPGK